MSRSINTHLECVLPPTALPNVAGAATTAIAGRSVTITFFISEDYPPVLASAITWQFTNSSGTTSISTAVDSRYTFSVDQLSLTISNISLTDEGSYKLLASNHAGNNSASAMLTVYSEYCSAVCVEIITSLDACNC